SAVAAVLTFVASTYIARELGRQRFEQRMAEEDLRGSTRELRHEMQVTGAISRVSREVIASLGAPALLDRLCQLTAEAVGCDAAFTFRREPGDGAFVVVAGHGERPERLARLRRQPVPEIALSELLHRFERGDVVQVVAASVADVLPIDAATT